MGDHLEIQTFYSVLLIWLNSINSLRELYKIATFSCSFAIQQLLICTQDFRSVNRWQTFYYFLPFLKHYNVMCLLGSWHITRWLGTVVILPHRDNNWQDSHWTEILRLTTWSCYSYKFWSLKCRQRGLQWLAISFMYNGKTYYKHFTPST